MTTIVYRDGVLAGDTMITSYGLSMPGANYAKVRRINDKWLIGMAGPMNAIELFATWATTDFDPAQRPDLTTVMSGDDVFSALVVHVKTGEVIEYERVLIAQTYDAEFRAIGSGAPVAFGAMAHGATAVEAVRIAAMFDKYTNNNVEYFFVENGENG